MIFLTHSKWLQQVSAESAETHITTQWSSLLLLRGIAMQEPSEGLPRWKSGI